MSDERRKFRSDEEWRKLLTEEQFHITRKHGTERPFTGPYLNEKTQGTYLCVCCGAPLFDSAAKYDSGSGWPSFHTPAPDARIAEHVDTRLLMHRTEVRCATCDAHLGHVFEDGPAPTGLRYCVNGTALKLKKTDQTP
jgi:peptide-methionine (R)-S-oxide reductase